MSAEADVGFSSVNTNLTTPLLIWIDDNPHNIAYEVAQAREMGVQVLELRSTEMAMAWIEINSAFLRENDRADRLRFISDNARVEMNARVGECLNPAAGDTFLRYLRGRSFNAPVLIYTGWSIDSTRYVESYAAAGSTTSSRVCLRYIEDLAAGKDDDAGWKGFRVW